MRASIFASLAFGLMGGCAVDSATALQLLVDYDAAWALEAFEVIVGDRSEIAPAESEVRVLLPDAWADVERPIRVVGRGGNTAAEGTAAAIPRLGETVRVSVELLSIGCENPCRVGDIRCEGNRVRRCGEVPGSCSRWEPGDPCPSERPFCFEGECQLTCMNQCEPSDTRCSGDLEQTCGDVDGDGCLEWLSPAACGAGSRCVADMCGPSCKGSCAECGCPAGCNDGSCACTPRPWVTARLFDHGASPAVVRDTGGSLHLAYRGDNALVYARRSPSGAWLSETVDEGNRLGQEPSIAVDADGEIFIVYVDAGNDVIKLARRQGTMPFEVSVLDEGGGRSAAAVGANGAHIIYEDWPDGTRYLFLPSGDGAPIRTLLDSMRSTGSYPSIALDPSGRVHMAYTSDMGRLVYASDIGGTLRTVTVDSASGWSTAIALDASGTVHLAYHQPTDGDLKYAVGSLSGGFARQIVDTESRNGAALFLSPAGVPHIFYPNGLRELRHAFPRGMSFEVELLPGMTAQGGDPTVVVTPNGEVSVVHESQEPVGFPHIEISSATICD